MSKSKRVRPIKPRFASKTRTKAGARNSAASHHRTLGVTVTGCAAD